MRAQTVTLMILKPVAVQPFWTKPNPPFSKFGESREPNILVGCVLNEIFARALCHKVTCERDEGKLDWAITLMGPLSITTLNPTAWQKHMYRDSISSLDRQLAALNGANAR